MGKLIITEYNDRLLSILFDEKRPCFMEVISPPSREKNLGNIYVAKVKDVVPGIHGAFLAISDKETVFLPFKDKQKLLVASGALKEGDTIRQGDEIVVQITKEALKTKQPVASGALTLTGRYCVCNYYGHGLTFSKKLTDSRKAELEETIRNAPISGRKKYKFTVRTNAGNLTDCRLLFEEMQAFIQIFDELTETYKHRTVYSCLYRAEAEVLRCIKNMPTEAYDEIVTDVEEVFSLIQSEIPEKVRFYKDEMLPLLKLYSVETHLKEALSKKVWLPCGGYLIIEPTEAMIVIDVNSGKTEHKDRKNENYLLKVNLEAAKEIARQLRLRNYSGMIMVDFINLEKQADKERLLQQLDDCLKKDKVPTRLVDMTALGIVEITRKKISRPLADFFAEKNEKVT